MSIFASIVVEPNGRTHIVPVHADSRAQAGEAACRQIIETSGRQDLAQTDVLVLVFAHDEIQDIHSCITNMANMWGADEEDVPSEEERIGPESENNAGHHNENETQDSSFIAEAREDEVMEITEDEPDPWENDETWMEEPLPSAEPILHSQKEEDSKEGGPEES